MSAKNPENKRIFNLILRSKTLSQDNKIAKIITKINRLPKIFRSRALSLVMGNIVPYVGTSKVVIEEMTEDKVVASIANKRRVQNHIKGVHATAMALLAETATGFIVVMNLPGGKLPLMKSMKIEYKKRTKGNMKVIATLTDEQRQIMLEQDKGEVSVHVEVTDESGKEPIRCEMIWAWITPR